MKADTAAESLPTWQLDEVRVGKVQPFGAIMSAIVKSPCDGPVAVSLTGLAGDAQGTPVIHGGPEKALLQYAAQHYAGWAAEFPDSRALFVPGGFGENLVATGPDEATLHIGDVVALGTAVLQVAQPRQPCFK